ncbi:MAG: PBP1A family penicillin-binding protein [Candidatus Gastranaerophilales bacterium]|nr:PBP1A family penicillin-binding protein [Candidatus Gastranaerophilales bacterium]
MTNKKNKKPNVFVSFIKTVFIIVIAFLSAGYVALKMYLNDLEPIPQLNNYNRNIVTQIYSSDNHIIKTFQTFHYQQVSINEIPQSLKDAIISTEDKNFYFHEGYDVLGIARSLIVNAINKKASQGASTITQQLARILFLSNEKTLTRKIKEIQIAARIEKTISKDKILEMYLNNVYLGAGAYGVGAAASIYFNKDLSQLTIAESALIAGLPQAPSVYSPYKNIKLAEKRRNKVLKRMYIMKTITKQQYESALAEKIVLNKKSGLSKMNPAPYFIDYVLKELEELGFDETEISHGGYKIITTLDYEAQIAANEAIEKNMQAWHLTKPKQQAALFSFSPTTGAIIAYCGGKDYTQSQYDRVIQAIRPPGSSFKPIVYTAAINKGWEPTDNIEDSPLTIGDWSPKNYGDKYRGKIPLFKALAISSNVAAVRLIKDIGIPAVIDMAKNLGITTPLTPDLTIALGSNGVKLYDMVIVYGNFANGGYKVKPYAIERIETQRGKVVYQAKRTRITKVLHRDTAGIMTAMLRKVITSGTGRGADIGKPMAGKTGTTNENRDAWFIGYTPDIVTGVFIGSDDNTSIGLTGGSAPARIWKDMMTVATEKYGNTDFDYPSPEFLLSSTGSYSIDLKEGEDPEAQTSTKVNTTEQTQSSYDNSENKVPEGNNLAPKPAEKTDSQEQQESFNSIPVQITLPENIKKFRRKSDETAEPVPVTIR